MRNKCVNEAKRIVVKVGSAVVTTKTGRLDRARMDAIVEQIVKLKMIGHQVVLVSSGAIAAGLERLGLTDRPTSIPELQAAASVGQGLLLQQYTSSIETHGMHVGQVLLTRDDIVDRRHYLNATNTFEKLLEYGVVPIINENDTTVVEEIKYGDNDELAALVTNLIKADALIIVSDIDGLYTADPRQNDKAELIAEVMAITPDIENLAGGAGSIFGSGGMVTKLNAAKIVTLAGAGMFLIDGKINNSLIDTMNGVEIGTFFAPRTRKMTSRKAWIAFGTIVKGTVTVDDGAKEALVDKGKSLLPAGVTDVMEDFENGDTVDIVDVGGTVFARGLVNLNATDLNMIKGMKSSDIREKYAELAGREVVHRDCLVILK